MVVIDTHVGSTGGGESRRWMMAVGGPAVVVGGFDTSFLFFCHQ